MPELSCTTLQFLSFFAKLSGLPAIPAEEGKEMKTTCKWWLTAIGGLALALTTVPNALAVCGQQAKMGHPASWVWGELEAGGGWRRFVDPPLSVWVREEWNVIP
jgi:hypothetical protein